MNKEMMRSIARAVSGRVKSVIAQVARQEASRFFRHLRERLKAGFAPPAGRAPRSLEPPAPGPSALPVDPPVAASEATIPAAAPQARSSAKRPRTAKTLSKRVAAKKATGTGETVATVDINTASRAELVTLPGIGLSRADAIMGGRPYKDPAELVEKRILPKALFTSLRERLRTD